MSDNRDKALLRAVAEGKLAEARAALLKGASPNAELTDFAHGASTWTPALYIAASEGNELMVRLLLKAGANPNVTWKRRGIVDFEEVPCLIVAFPHLEIVRLLLQHGADPNRPSIWGEDRANETSPMESAKGNEAVRKLLMQYGGRKRVITTLDGA